MEIMVISLTAAITIIQIQQIKKISRLTSEIMKVAEVMEVVIIAASIKEKQFLILYQLMEQIILTTSTQVIIANIPTFIITK